jgi:glycosyltransferase involved in cell wall biosynthesis
MRTDYPNTRRATDLEQLPPPVGKRGWPWTLDEAPPVKQQRQACWPRISIVTPSFNQGQFIEETIRSVLLQGYPNLEFIIMDGGSTDNTVEIIKKYEPWITYWVSEKDRGQCHAINKGFARATGDILAWLCSDDVYASGALHKIAEIIGNQKMAVAIGDSIITHGPDSLEGKLDRRRPSFAAMAYNIRTLAQPSVFWTSDLWRIAGPLNEELYFMMDYDLWLRMMPAARSVAYVDSVLSYQRSQPQQKSNVNHPLFQKYRQLRVEIPRQAAQLRGESGFGWLVRVWWFQLCQRRGRFWRVMKPGFHWEALRWALRRG